MSSSASDLRQSLAQTEASSLSLRARQLASGWASGSHRADRKGSGVEFAGHREYSPGDDLRHLDRHAWLRHQKLLVREFLTDTERAVHIVVDVTDSMRYRGQGEAPGRTSKAHLGLLIGAALAYVARHGGDHVGLTTVTNSSFTTFKPQAGREAFERIIHHCEQLDAQPDASVSSNSPDYAPLEWKELLHALGNSLPRGTLIFALSDFLDTDPEVRSAWGALSTKRRTVRALQILTPEELHFPFEGSLRLQDLESGREIETEASGVRKQYQAALSQLTNELKVSLSHSGGALLQMLTTDAPEDALRSLASGEEVGHKTTGGKTTEERAR